MLSLVRTPLGRVVRVLVGSEARRCGEEETIRKNSLASNWGKPRHANQLRIRLSLFGSALWYEIYDQ
jgi:hypothetical protein